MKKVFQKSKFFLLLGAFMIPVFIFSFLFTSQIKASKLVLLDQGQVVDKTYFAAGDVLDIRGTVNGDVFLAGSDITLSGTVNGNLFVAANSINLSGTVNGIIFSAGNTLTINSEGIESLYAAGNLININSKIQKNSYIAGNSVVVTNNSGFGQDLFISSNTVNLNANVKRDLSIESVMATIDSNISRDASLLSESVYFGGNAHIIGNLEVSKTIQTMTNLDLITDGQISVVEDISNPGLEYLESFKSKVFGKLTVGLFSTLLVGFLMIKFFEKFLIKINKDSEKNLGKNLGKGFIFLLGLPLISFLLLITIVGIKLSFLVICVYMLFVFIASVIGSIFIGEIFLRKLMREKSPSLHLSLLVGSLIFVILTIIPFIGWIFGLIIILISLGSLINFKTEALKILNKKA